MKLARYILLIALTSLMILGIFWAREKGRDEVCTEVVVEILNNDSTQFVTPLGVIEELEKKHIIVKDRPVWQINVEDIERQLEESPYIEMAQCVFENGGRLKIQVQQIVPVMRVFEGDKSYYVNKDGKRMNASATFHADVPIVMGKFTRAYGPLRLWPMIKYVEQDSALKSLVTMYSMRDSNNIFIVPSIHGHVVNMGNCDDFEGKFKKLKLFYEKVMPVKGWMYYDTISVKWNHQVVATRRDKIVEVVEEYDPEFDEQADDIQTMQVSGDSKAPVNKMVKQGKISQPAKSAPATKGPEPKAAAAKQNQPPAAEPKKEPAASKKEPAAPKKTTG